MNHEILQKYLDENPFAKLRDVVAKLLYDEIISLDILPGTKLNINQIAANLGISRTPVAEAVAQLCEKGFVVSRSDSPGYYVLNLSMSDMINLYRVRPPPCALREQAPLSWPSWKLWPTNSGTALLKRTTAA